MKTTPRHVLGLWRLEPTRAASFTTIRQTLGLKKSQTATLQALLDGMVREGKLSYDRRRYRLAAAKPQAAPTAPHRKEGRRGRDGHPAPGQAPRGMEGVISVHPDGFGFVTIAGRRESLFVPPRQVGGALDGDRVRVELARHGRDERTSGKVTAVLERKRKTVRGFVQIERGETWVLPLNEKLPMLYVAPEHDTLPHGREDVVEAEIVTYPRDANTAPSGRILQVIEDADTPPHIVESILADLQIPTDFSRAAAREADAMPGKAPAAKSPGREDQTRMPFVTIDGADARDFDDAVCLSPLPERGWRLSVAIADVAHYLRPGTALDDDAYARGTSVYFPQRVVPMLPEVLSNDLCSLRPREPRPTLTCEMELDADGSRTGYRIVESLIESKARLTYGEVQTFLEKGRPAALGKAARQAEMLAEMGRLADILREKRQRRGALGFEFPEARFAFGKGERPERVDKAFPTRATKLIEQFMLEANETVAWHCAENEIPILYRVHDPPPPDQVAELRLQLQVFGVEVQERELTDPRGISALLARVRKHPAWEELELMVLRSLSQAQYRASNDGHFALNATHYTHFTSPIRRYPDLLVHRALKASLHSRGRKGGRAQPFPAEAGLHLSTRERTAGEAEGRVIRLYRVLYMEPFLGESFAGTVSGVSAKGLWVGLKEHFVDGFLPLAMLPDDYYSLDARRNVLRGRRTRREIRYGERLTVQLARAERMTQELEFGFNGWGWEDEDEPAAPPKRGGAKRPPKGKSKGKGRR